MTLASDAANPQTATYPEAVVCSLNALIQLRGHPLSTGGKRQHRTTSLLAGGHKSHFRGRGMDFEEVRRYQPGDEIRHIDWRVTARTGATHTKVFREERERPIYLVVDQSRSMFFGSQRQFKSVLAAKLAAHIAWEAYQRQDRIGGILFNHVDLNDFKPRSGRQGALFLLHQLAEMNRQLAEQRHQGTVTHPTCTLLSALYHLRSIAKPGSMIYIISDFKSVQFHNDVEYDEIESLLNQLRRHNDLQALNIFDPLECKLPSIGRLGISDGVRKREIDTRDQSIQQQHTHRFMDQQRQLQQLLEHQAIRLLHFTTALPADEQLTLAAADRGAELPLNEDETPSSSFFSSFINKTPSKAPTTSKNPTRGAATS